MIGYIPFTPSTSNYKLGVPIDGTRYMFDPVRWNAREGAWYFDLREEDQTPIALGIKVVLGVNLGRRSAHPFFADHLLFAYDTSGQGRDPGFDDFGDGQRVVVVHMNAEDVLAQLEAQA